jgi:hypothetical protein
MRRLFALLTIFSLLVFLATLILWIRSHHLSDQIQWRNSNGARTIYSAEGSLVLDLFFIDWSREPIEFRSLQYQRDQRRAPLNYILLLNFDAGDIDIEWKHAGFSWWERRSPKAGRRLIIMALPFWFVAIFPGILPVSYLTLRLRSGFIRRRMKQKGLCVNCGYDLRATPKGSPCPECGLSELGAVRW